MHLSDVSKRYFRQILIWCRIVAVLGFVGFGIVTMILAPELYKSWDHLYGFEEHMAPIIVFGGIALAFVLLTYLFNVLRKMRLYERYQNDQSIIGFSVHFARFWKIAAAGLWGSCLLLIFFLLYIVSYI